MPSSQHDRIEVDRSVRFFRRQYAGSDHQTAAKQGRPSPVNPVYGYLAEGHDGVGCKKDQPGSLRKSRLWNADVSLAPKSRRSREVRF
jgi:hypothetical protein